MTHGAHLSLREPYLVPGVRIHSLSTLLEGPAGATCLQHLQNKSTCFVSGRLVPHGAHLSLKEPHLVLGVRIHSVLIRFGGSSWCNMSPASRNKKTCLQLWQACAPWGSFVFDRAPFGFWSTNSLLVDPFGGSSWCNMSPASGKKSTCL